ncbi:hypothetical protein [Fretibacter rubidus]|uniref:hypothetical protein n=1 Tax=Fretibacter rubidus TaxID=570162 RepID=UPI00352A1071
MFNPVQSKIETRFALGGLCAVFLWASIAQTAQAQQREFYNGSFEANDPQGPGTPNWQIFNNAAVDEWSSTTNEIELWDSTF